MPLWRMPGADALVLQVRLQSKENRQRGPVVIIREVVRDHGIRGLWRGTTPAAVGC